MYTIQEQQLRYTFADVNRTRRNGHCDPTASSEQTAEWQKQYLDALKKMGWNFELPPKGDPRTEEMLASDEITPKLIKEWRNNGVPIEMSIVIVPPNTDVSALPIRTLGYAASALAMTEGAREVGVNVDTLRILAPSRINTYVNGGNTEQQLANAETLRGLITDYKDAYYPSLKGVDVTLDTGLPVTETRERELLPLVSSIERRHPEIATRLQKVGERYNLNGSTPHVLSDAQRSLAYLVAHPEAWGYSDTTRLFAPNGERRINLLPASELRYLTDMKRVQDCWEPSKGKQIATIIGTYNHPPYYAYTPTEYNLGDLANKGMLTQSLDMQAQRSPDVNQAVRQLRRDNLWGKQYGAPPIPQLVRRALAR